MPLHRNWLLGSEQKTKRLLIKTKHQGRYPALRLSLFLPYVLRITDPRAEITYAKINTEWFSLSSSGSEHYSAPFLLVAPWLKDATASGIELAPSIRPQISITTPGEDEAIDLLPVEVDFIAPDDDSWSNVLPKSRVVLKDEQTKIRVRIHGMSFPDKQSLSSAHLDVLKLSGSTDFWPGLTSSLYLTGTETQMVSDNNGTELRVSLSSDVLRSLGLLDEPTEDDGDSRAVVDYVKDSDSNFVDSQGVIFAPGWEPRYRGYARNMKTPETSQLKQNPWVSQPDLSFIKAGGAKRLMASFQGAEAYGLVMNQADFLYFSGHGFSGSYDHSTMLEFADDGPGATPADVTPYWNDNLGVVVIAGCAVLNINNWVANPGYYPPPTGPGANYWPGKLWVQTGPEYLLGYGSTAPLDTQGADTIASSFLQAYDAGTSPFYAWRDANFNSHGRNAVAIHKNDKLGYFKKTEILGFPIYNWTEVPKSEWP